MKTEDETSQPTWRWGAGGVVIQENPPRRQRVVTLASLPAHLARLPTLKPLYFLGPPPLTLLSLPLVSCQSR